MSRSEKIKHIAKKISQKPEKQVDGLVKRG